MGATEETFAALAERANPDLVRSASVPGLTGRGHRERTLEGLVPEETLTALGSIHAALGGDSDLLSTKRAVPIRLDFLDVGRRLVIEIDEIQHFTTDRLRTFELCPRVVATQRRAYLPLIDAWSARADGYRAAKPASDFPFAGGRRAQRAYLDAARDLLLPELGYTLLRIPAPECNGSVAYDRFLELTAAGI